MAEGVHCNRFFFEKIIRQLAIKTAFVYLYAWYGSTDISNINRMQMSLTKIRVSCRCAFSEISSGRFSSCQPAAAITASSTIKVTVSVQNHGKGSKNHPASNNSIRLNGSRLLRRLSNIFQRLSAESLLPVSFPAALLTRGNIHAPICQSPRIQRCWRLMSASYFAGLSSYKTTLLSKPDLQ